MTSAIVSVLASLTLAGMAAQPLYDLKQTDGMSLFRGSAEAAKILERQGFVVAAPEYMQIFEPYLRSDLQVFVTPDTAWHTYHILLEEGVKEMERTQSARLREFSRHLLDAARAQATNSAPEFAAISDYASIGLAFQEPAYRETLGAEQQRLIQSLTNGTAPVRVPIGFPLSPVSFRPQSFYTESEDLSDFYRARTWYANVDFRLANERETLLAVYLAWLIESDAKLLKLWNQLTDPYDAFVAPADDGSVSVYTATARALLAGEFGPVKTRAHLAEIRRKLQTAVPVPRINDQSLSPAEFSRFAETTRGFRLLPTRQLPCEVCFQNTVEPKSRGRFLPSGLDFVVASPVLRSAAAKLAMEGQFGKPILEAVQKADCPAMPRSLYGQSMELLAKLQERLPATAPAPLRTEAWSDLQLWMQLAAWSEQRHTWALYSKMGAITAGIHTPPPGIVAPYPAFFSGLAKLSRDSAEAFANIVADDRFDPSTLAAELYRFEAMMHNNYNGISEQEKQRLRPQLDHFSRFIRQFYSAHEEQMNDARKLQNDLDDMLKQVSETGKANAEETKTLRMYFECRQFAPPILRRLAEVCDQLAVLAQKQLSGEALTHDDADWVRRYGGTIAGLQGYYSDTWPDEFPIISRIFHDQFNGAILYAGVARPQTLYMVLPYKGGLQLYRGAVLSYREFARPENQPLDDNSWRELVQQRKAPPAPPFTSSFLSAGTPMPSQQNSAAFAPEVKQGEPGKIQLNLKEVPLGPTPKVLVKHEGWLTMSEDCRHVAYRARGDGKWWVVCDGVAGNKYDDVNYMMFSPDGEHLVYIARAGSNSCVVLDGVEGDRFSSIRDVSKSQWPFVFSPNSKHHAYVGNIDRGNHCVVVDGKRGPVLDEVLHHSFSFSENSEHWVYAAHRDGKGIVIKDGEEVMRCEDVLSQVQRFGDTTIGETFGPFLSADGEHLACAIRKGANWVVSVDGKEGVPWDSILQLEMLGPSAGFSPDGRHFTYVGQRGQKVFVVVDQQEYPNGSVYCAAFSPDSKHVAFAQATQDGNNRVRNCVVLDGVAGRDFAGQIEHLTFSPDGSKLAYRVGEPIGEGYWVLHGGPEFDDYGSTRDIEFSPDSNHFAFLAGRSGAAYYVIDGKPHLKSAKGPSGFRSDYFTFSPDNKSWAYISERDRNHYAVISGLEYGPYDFIGEPDEEEYIYFSPDSRHFAFMATRDYWASNYRGKQFLVVDGRDYALDGASWLNGSVLRFDSATKLHGLIMNEDRISILEAEIH